ncbi:methyltransferase family protein [Actinomadura pelletieri DSM 43383]|uniref:Methyltransferase family protein n=1 Tax=Actinomadura pelletieri DSM 43383 TaxID=1120940 RepID=A0A495QJG1_9ACTN|nr:class I SAM-dependent methyltransferase [Actinomadura pelletieri]RKS72287.1 methyltransferase family protein [Actinomadura pelletieri DSM 43383]
MQENGGVIAPHLRRLLEFVEPDRDDVCLDVARGRGPMPAALGPQVRHMTAVDAMPVPVTAPVPAGVPASGTSRRRMSTVEFGTGPVRIADGDALPASAAATTREDRIPHPVGPDGVRIRADATALPYRDNTFSLVTARFSLYNLGDPDHVLRELLRVCRPGGRVVIADLVRGNLVGPDRDRIERLRDPDHPGTPTIARLTEMITSAGGSIRRLDVFTVERPVEPWLAGACDDETAERIRVALVDEVDGGPRTGAKPRVIGGELWFTQTWAHVAAEPIS